MANEKLTYKVDPSMLVEGWYQIVLVRGTIGSVLPAPIKSRKAGERLGAAIVRLLQPGLDEMVREREERRATIDIITQPQQRVTKKFAPKDWMPRFHVRRCANCKELAKEEDWLNKRLYECEWDQYVAFKQQPCPECSRVMQYRGDEICPHCEAEVEYADVLAVADREGKWHEVDE